MFSSLKTLDKGIVQLPMDVQTDRDSHTNRLAEQYNKTPSLVTDIRKPSMRQRPSVMFYCVTHIHVLLHSTRLTLIVRTF